jgi:hypothetical protein
MNPEAATFWARAIQALKTAQSLVSLDADAAASRAYYAAFYAVSALFTLEGKTFTRHGAVEVAVHRDLIRAGRWLIERGQDYSFLLRLRATGDYGGSEHVSTEEAAAALEAAHRILQAVGLQAQSRSQTSRTKHE